MCALSPYPDIYLFRCMPPLDTLTTHHSTFHVGQDTTADVRLCPLPPSSPFYPHLSQLRFCNFPNTNSSSKLKYIKRGGGERKDRRETRTRVFCLFVGQIVPGSNVFRDIVFIVWRGGPRRDLSGERGLHT